MRFARRFVSLGACSAVIALAACRDDTTLPTDPPATGPVVATASTALVFRSITAGADHTCGVTTSSRAYCWGSSFLGRLGSPGAVSYTHLTLPTN